MKINKEIDEIEIGQGTLKNDYFSIQVEHRFQSKDVHQFLLTTERCRVPELLFQPSLMGKKYCGLSEAIQSVLSLYDKETQENLVKSIFLCGGSTRFSGFADRLSYDIRQMLPPGTLFNIYDESSSLDAWKGAAHFARQEGFFDSAIKRSDIYEE